MSNGGATFTAALVSGLLGLGAAGPAAAEDPAALARSIVDDLSDGRFSAVEARMSAEMRMGLPEAKLKEVWESLAAGGGPLTGVGPISVAPVESHVVAVAPLLFKTRTIDLRLTLSQETLIGLFLAPHKELPAVWAPPAYADLSAFRELEVAIGTAPRALPATLALPERPGKAPVVILIHGSGPQDRDESQGPNRPFRDLAEGLASRGIAVLRYEKRTKMYPADFAADPRPTVQGETLDDAALAIALVKSRPEIDSRRIVVLGHSLGATLAPRIAAAHQDVAAIVMLAAASRPLPTIMLEQMNYLIGLGGEPNAQQTQALAAMKAEVARVEAARPGEAGAPFMGVPISYWEDLNVYDPAATAANLTIPMLVLQGGRDYQVTRPSYDRFAARLEGRRNATLEWFPRLNHLFMPGEGAPGPADYDRPGHVDPVVIDTIARFVSAL